MVNLFLFVLLLVNLIQIINPKIHFAFEIFRHGARAPYIGLSKEGIDCYGYSWPGISELSNVGLRMHFLLGVRNRQRYIKEEGLLSSSFVQSEINVMSTDVNRTLLSVTAQLQGLYPPSTGPTLDSTQRKTAVPPNKKTDFSKIDQELQSSALPTKMDSIPVHTFYPKDHTFQLHDKKNCPSVEKKFEEVLKRKEVKDFIKKFKAKYGKILQEIQGAKDDSFLDDYWETYKYLDTFIADRTNGKSIDVLKKKGVDFDDFEKYAAEFLYLDYFGTNFQDNDLAIVSMTHTAKSVVNWMEKTINKIRNTPKLVLFSAHDTTIGAFEVFNKIVFNTELIEYAPFAANGFYELYTKTDSDTDTEYYVRYIYNEKLKFDVTFEDFKAKIESNVWSNEKIAEYCQWDSKDSNNYWIYLSIATGILTAILLSSLIYLLVANKKAKDQIISGSNKDPLGITGF